MAGYRLLFGRQLCGQRRVLVLQTGKRAFLLGILCRQAGNGLLQLVQRTLKLRRFGRVAGKCWPTNSCAFRFAVSGVSNGFRCFSISARRCTKLRSCSFTLSSSAAGGFRLALGIGKLFPKRRCLLFAVLICLSSAATCWAVLLALACSSFSSA